MKHIYNCLLPMVFLLIIIALLYFLGFRVVYVKTENIPWEAIAAIGQISAALATFLAVLIALFPKRKQLETFLIFSPDQPSTLETFAQLVISNLGDRAVTLKKIEFGVKDVMFGEFPFINDEYWLACAEIIIIETNQTKLIPIPYNSIRKHIGHIEIPEGKVHVTVTDILGDQYQHETKHSFDTFCDLLFCKVNKEVCR